MQVCLIHGIISLAMDANHCHLLADHKKMLHTAGDNGTAALATLNLFLFNAILAWNHILKAHI